MMDRTVFLAAALLLGGAYVGCASAPPPTQWMQASQSAIRTAQDFGAAGVPQAARFLQMAKQQADRAQLAVADNKVKKATGLLMRAEADAALALALARESSARSEAQQAMDRVHALKLGHP
jgi:hypothetical protein